MGMLDEKIFMKVCEDIGIKKVQILDNLNFSRLATSVIGKDICRCYVTSMIRLGLGGNEMKNLSHTCPSFFHYSLHLVFRANKLISELKRFNRPRQSLRKQRICEIMQNYKLAAQEIGFNLRRCCDTLRCAHLFYDVVELVDFYIKKIIPSQRKKANLTVETYYQEILYCLTLIVNQKTFFITSNGNVFSPVPPSKQTFLLSITVNRSLQIENNSFRQDLYDILLRLNRIEIIFEMKPKNLENF